MNKRTLAYSAAFLVAFAGTLWYQYNTRPDALPNDAPQSSTETAAQPSAQKGPSQGAFAKSPGASTADSQPASRQGTGAESVTDAQQPTSADTTGKDDQAPPELPPGDFRISGRVLTREGAPVHGARVVPTP